MYACADCVHVCMCVGMRACKCVSMSVLVGIIEVGIIEDLYVFKYICMYLFTHVSV